MKSLLTVTLIFFVLFCDAQLNEKYKISLQSGYFTDVFFGAESPGFALKGTFGYKMKNDIWINFNITQAEVRESFTDYDLFQTEGMINQNYRIFGVDFSKDFILRKKHCLSPVIGFVYHQWFYSPPIYACSLDSDLNSYYWGFKMNGEVWHDLGLNVDFAYRYLLRDKLSIGVTAGTYYLLGLGFVGLTVCPTIEIRL